MRASEFSEQKWYCWFHKNELNELPSKVKVISIKGLAKDLINKFSILNGTKYFSSGILQNYVELIPAKKYIKYLSGTTQINSWKSNGMSEKNTENITKSDGSIAPTFVDYHILPDITNFNGHCLFLSLKRKNLYISLYICISIYLFHNSMVKNLKQRLYIKGCICICKAD